MTTNPDGPCLFYTPYRAHALLHARKLSIRYSTRPSPAVVAVARYHRLARKPRFVAWPISPFLIRAVCLLHITTRSTCLPADRPSGRHHRSQPTPHLPCSVLLQPCPNVLAPGAYLGGLNSTTRPPSSHPGTRISRFPRGLLVVFTMEVARQASDRLLREESGPKRTALPTRPLTSAPETHSPATHDASSPPSIGSRSPGTESFTASVQDSNMATSPSPSPLPSSAAQDERMSPVKSNPTTTQTGQVCR